MSAAGSAGTREWWEVLGIILAVLVAVAGLVILALIVLFVVAMGSFGSNK